MIKAGTIQLVHQIQNPAEADMLGMVPVTILAGCIFAALAGTVAGSQLRLSASVPVRDERRRVGVDYHLRLNNFGNVQYSAPLSLGDQTVPAIYDTGSFEILVLSSKCQKCSSEQIQYDSSMSKTFHAGSGITTQHLFGSGSAQSVSGLETVYIGPEGSPIAVDNMTFWQVVDHSIEVWNENAHFSGIVGLGLTDTVPEGYGAGVSDERTLLSALGVGAFAMCLERGQVMAPGWLSMGPSFEGVEQSDVFSALPVVGQVHWGVKMTSFDVDGYQMQNPCIPSCGAIVDSGTSLIGVPKSAKDSFDFIANLVKPDCSNIESLPSIHFNLDGVDMALPPQAYVVKLKQEFDEHNNSSRSVWERLFGSKTKSESRMELQCTAAFMTFDKESEVGPVFILGMPFLRYHYTVFDRQRKKLLIARSTPACAPIASSGAGGFSGVARAAHGSANASGLSRAGLRGAGGTRAPPSPGESPLELSTAALRVPAWAVDGATRMLTF